MRDEKINWAKAVFTGTLTKEDGRRERESRKAWGTKGWTLLLCVLKQILLESVTTKCISLGANLGRMGTLAFFVYHRGMYLYTY